ncbi:unnamed protein product [Linum tenue]|uniref:Uncharacterized protein n=1 Tax=Linum tenue TaxID=586396 RepID=A0AAV0KG00_9ROSI|nr:unnamed protein product [Linum tenue]
MGFRDMKGFNKALLVKQLWSLSQRPEALISILLRAKYHKQCTILEARLGGQPSYIWRSIIGAQGFLCQGLRWRVGNGAQVRIWGDSWLPDGEVAFINSAPKVLPVDSFVRELIDPVTNQWDVDLVGRCFPAEIAEVVLAIPLRSNDEQDRLIWRHNYHGGYTVRDGYSKWLDDFKQREGIVTQGSSDFWKKVWKLNIPPKVRHFLCKFIREILPTGVKVNAKNDQRSETCPFCNELETQKHYFRECAWSSRIWRASPFAELFETQNVGNCLEWVVEVMKEANQSTVEGWAMLLWALWKARNAQLFNGAKWPEHEIILKSQSILEEYQMQQQRNYNIPASTEQTKWRRPPTGWTKVNTDAGMLAGGGFGLGAVIRDHNGRLIVASAKNIRGSAPSLGSLLRYIKTMAVQSVMELDIPSVVQSHGKPITVGELGSALKIAPARTPFLARLMRMLAHMGYFVENLKDGDDETATSYSATLMCGFLVKDSPFSAATWFVLANDPIAVDPWRLDSSTPPPPPASKISRSPMLTTGRSCTSVGPTSEDLAEAFPGIHCTVFDLAQVVSPAGDVFQEIPPADAVFLKWVLCDWSDESCVKILKQAKEAVTSSNGGVKVMIVEMVGGHQSCSDREATGTLLYLHMFSPLPVQLLAVVNVLAANILAAVNLPIRLPSASQQCSNPSGFEASIRSSGFEPLSTAVKASREQGVALAATALFYCETCFCSRHLATGEQYRSCVNDQ